MIEPVDHGGQGIGLRVVVRFASVAAVAYQLCALEHGQMLGDRGLGDSGIASEGVDGLLAVASQVLEDGAAGGVGESAEDEIGIGQRHRQTITKRLWFVKSEQNIFFDCGLLGGIG